MKSLGTRQAICALAAERGAAGIASADLTALGIHHKHVGTHCHDLVEQQRLFRAALPGYRLRWFATEGWRDAYEANPPAAEALGRGAVAKENRAKLTQPASPKLVAPKQKKWLMDMNGRGDLSRAPLATNRAGPQIRLPGSSTAVHGALTSGKKPVAGEPVITAKTKVTICPGYAHDPRYHVEPGEMVFGAGFVAAGIGRDITTGRAWR